MIIVCPGAEAAKDFNDFIPNVQHLALESNPPNEYGPKIENQRTVVIMMTICMYICTYVYIYIYIYILYTCIYIYIYIYIHTLVCTSDDTDYHWKVLSSRINYPTSLSL